MCGYESLDLLFMAKTLAAEHMKMLQLVLAMPTEPAGCMGSGL